MIYILIFLTAVLSFSCGNKVKENNIQKQNQTDEKQNQNSQYTLKPNQVIITPVTEDFMVIFGSNYKSFTPQNSEVEIADKLLKESFDKEKSGTVNRLFGKRLEDYNIQFAGATDESGDKIIWINCFCKPEKENDEWKHRAILAKGGGYCFFNLKVNITKNTSGDLNVNGNK